MLHPLPALHKLRALEDRPYASVGSVGMNACTEMPRPYEVPWSVAMALPHWRADTSRRPLVIVHLAGADGVQQPNVESLICIADDLIEKRERVVVVYDLTGSRPDAQRRRVLVNRLRENSESLSRYVVASAIVAPTPFHRGILVATFWFVQPKSPAKVFDDRPAAIEWALTQGRHAGLRLPGRPEL